MFNRLILVLKANYGAKRGQVIAGRLVRGNDGRFSSSGASPVPKPHLKLRPIKAAPKGRVAKGRKPAKPVKTGAQRAAERQARQAAAVQARGALREQNIVSTFAALGLSEDAANSLRRLAAGEVIADDGGLANRGLAEPSAAGTGFRLTATGRAVMHASERGDLGAARDAIGRAADHVASVAAAAAAKLADAAKPKGGGGGGKKKEPPVKLVPLKTATPTKVAGGGGGKGSAPKLQAPAVSSADPALVALAQRVSNGEGLDDAEAQALIRNGLARATTRGLVLTGAGARAIRTKAASRWAQLLARVKAAMLPPTRILDAGHTGVMVALTPDAQALKALAALPGVTEPADQIHLTLAYLGDSTETPLATNKARLIATIRQWAAAQGRPLTGTINGAGRFFHAEKDDTNAVWVAPDVAGLPELRQSLVKAIEAGGFDYSQDHGFTPHITVAYVAKDAPTPPMRIETPVTFDRVTLAWGDEQYDFPLGAATTKDAAPALLVYKDHAGASRWIARTTTAYRDRDREILPIAALDADSQRMTATKQYGPLRWWHVGEPNALTADAPWGAGLDLGMCDYSVQIGRTRVESGTFKDATIAQRIAATADQFELSPGFFHAADQPDQDGVFQQIHTFERSLVPVRHGRASNLFTGLTVAHKEYHMDAAEQTRRFQAAVKELDLTPEQAQQLSAGLLATDKAAQTTTDPATGLPGVAFKSDDAPPPPPAGLMDTLRLWLNGDKATAVATKEAPVVVDPTAALTAQMAELTATLKDALAPVELKAPADDVVAEEEDAAEDTTGVVADEATTLGAMAPAAFLDMLTQALTQAMAAAMGGISDKVATLDNEMKTMGYVRQKDAQAETARAAQIAALKAQLDELTGDQPAIPPTRPSQDPSNVLSTLKDVNPAEEFAFADITAQLFGGQIPTQ